MFVCLFSINLFRQFILEKLSTLIEFCCFLMLGMRLKRSHHALCLVEDQTINKALSFLSLRVHVQTCKKKTKKQKTKKQNSLQILCLSLTKTLF